MLQRSISNFRVKFFPEGLADPAEPLMEFDGALTYVRETLKFHGEDITSFQVTDAHGDVTEAVRGALAIEYAYRRGEAHSSFSELVYDPVEDAAQAFDQS